MSSQPQPAEIGTVKKHPPSYDACTPGILPVDQVGFVESVHRAFLQSLARRLSESLETPVAADLAEIEQMPFAEFLSSSDGNACLIRLNAVPGGQAILELPAGFIHRVLGILIGAPENAVCPERGVTGIERHILRECFDQIALALREAWEGHGVRFEPGPASQGDEAGQPAPEGGAVVADLMVSLGRVQQTLRLAMPALLVRLAVKDTSGPVVSAQAGSRPVILEALGAAAVRVEALLGGSSLRMRDLLALQPGQVLTLGPPASCSVECVINGQSKFRGELVSTGRSQAFLIGSAVEPRSSPRD